MSGKEPGRDPYLVKSVVHSSQLLSAFRSSGENGRRMPERGDPYDPAHIQSTVDVVVVERP